MYGLVKGCFLGPEERDDWNAHYCGLCLALKHDYGMAARMAVNGDAVLLSMLCEAQSPDKWPRMTHRCAFRKFRPAAVIAPGPPGIHYAAAMSLLMAASKIADHIADKDSFVKRFPDFFSRLAAYWQKKSRITSYNVCYTKLLRTAVSMTVMTEMAQRFFTGLSTIS